MNYLDRSIYGIRTDNVPYTDANGQLEIVECVAFAVHNQGDDSVTLGNGIIIPSGSQYSDCGACCLDFVENMSYQFAGVGTAPKILLVRTKLVLKESCAVKK